MHELRIVGELKALFLDSIPLQEWGLYGERFDGLIEVRKEAKAEALRDAQEIIAGFEHTIDEARERDDMINTGYLIQELDAEIQDLQGDSQ